MSYTPPGQLTIEDLPAAPISAENLWVLWNLQRAFAMKNPYEHQLYGPVNSFLVAIFVLRRLFSVNPQHVHRAVLEYDESKGHSQNLSIGSTGGFHQSRSVKQDAPQQKEKQYPDFTVVKVISTPWKAPRELALVCILEIKLEDVDEVGKVYASMLAYNQMLKYMTRMRDLPNRGDVLYGFLLSAASSTYERWAVRKDGSVEKEEQGIPIFDGPAPLAQVLGNLACLFWNI